MAFCQRTIVPQKIRSNQELEDQQSSALKLVAAVNLIGFLSDKCVIYMLIQKKYSFDKETIVRVQLTHCYDNPCIFYKQNKTKTHFHVPRKYQHTAGFPKKMRRKQAFIFLYLHKAVQRWVWWLQVTNLRYHSIQVLNR